MRFGARSDKGIVRKINEDSYRIIFDNAGKPYCFIVADGLGGHNSGEIASKMAVDHVTEYIHKHRYDSASSITDVISNSIKDANNKIYENAKANIKNHGMGTTIIVCLTHGNKVYIGHVGDSRVYLIRNGSIKRLTTDHSYIEELISSGTLTREEAKYHPRKNVITRAVGFSGDVAIDTYESEYMDNDIYLLCTDGLTNKLDESELLDVIEKLSDLQEACDELVKLSNEKGGEDNITVVAFS